MLFGANVLILLFLLFGGIILQIFLSRQKNKWLGLILPILIFVFSLIPVFGILYFETSKTEQITTSDGVIIEKTEQDENTSRRPNIGTTIAAMAVNFIMFNIPTAVLLLIYFVCRASVKKNNLLDKMNIQDLE